MADAHYTDEWTPVNPVILEALRPLSDGVVEAVCSPSSAEVGSRTSVTLTLTLGPGGLPQGDSLVVTPVAKGVPSWPPLQDVMPEEAGFTTVESASGRRLTGLISGRRLRITADEGALGPGDRIIVRFGDARAGGPGIAMTLAALRVRFRILHEPRDNSEAREAQASPVCFDLLPAAPVALDVLGPSCVGRGERFEVVVKAVDAYGNTARPTVGSVRVSPVIGMDLGPELGLNEGGRAARRAAGVVTDRLPPVSRIRLVVRDQSGRLEGRGNPMEILSPNAEQGRIFWGDLHAHTSHGHAYGEIEDLYLYARDEARLDFVAHVEHYTAAGESWLNPWWRRRYAECRTVEEFIERSWAERLREVRRFDEPGRFVPLLAFEWAHVTGHLNGYFPTIEGPCVYPTSFRDPAMTPDYLKGLLEGREWTAIPHHTSFPMGRGTLCGFEWGRFDPDVMPCVEIASKQGNSEFLGAPYAVPPSGEGGTVAEGLRRGLRFGFVGGTDTNLARPGSFTEQEKRQRRPALTAVFARTLDRRAVYEAIRRRRCYAAMGGRIIVRFCINGACMGESLRLESADEKKLITCEVSGTDDLALVEVLKNGRRFFQYGAEDVGRQNRGLDYQEQFPDQGTSRPGDYYYLRVRQMDGAMAWSSPIWIDV